jgi:hypothetical protein
VNPRVKVVLIEAAVTIGTGVALWALMQYGPAAVDAAAAAWRGYTAAPPAVPLISELDVSEFTAGLAGPITDKLKAENWGW